jgi:hypothetical protein
MPQGVPGEEAHHGSEPVGHRDAVLERLDEEAVPAVLRRWSSSPQLQDHHFL